MPNPLIPEVLPPIGQPGSPLPGQAAVPPQPEALEGEADFQSLPPEAQMALVELIQQMLETGQLPPEIQQLVEAAGGGPPPMAGPPQVGPMPMAGPPQGMPPQPMPPGAGPQMPMPPQGMQEGGEVRGKESLENLHRKINEAKQKLKDREKALREEAQAVTQPGSRGVAPHRPLTMAEGGNVPSSIKRDPDYYLPPQQLPSAVQEWRDMGGQGVVNMGELVGRSQTSTPTPALPSWTTQPGSASPYELPESVRMQMMMEDPSFGAVPAEQAGRVVNRGFGPLTYEEASDLAHLDYEHRNFMGPRPPPSKK